MSKLVNEKKYQFRLPTREDAARLGIKTTWLAAQPKNNKNLAVKEGQEVWYNVKQKLTFHCIYNLKDVRYNFWSAWGLCSNSCGEKGIRRVVDSLKNLAT